jgi:large subunit ribosomal protein L7/L12
VVESPKVQKILDDILTMNVIETIELVNVLKDKFGYVEQAAVMAMPAGGGPAAAAVAEEPVVEKTEFTVRLDKFNPNDKIKVIKEVRTITGLGLKQAKDLVESAPEAIIKKDLPKAEADELLAKIKAVGGECVLE